MAQAHDAEDAAEQSEPPVCQQSQCCLSLFPPVSSPTHVLSTIRAFPARALFTMDLRSAACDSYGVFSRDLNGVCSDVSNSALSCPLRRFWHPKAAMRDLW
jgi:hypothetical protein